MKLISKFWILVILAAAALVSGCATQAPTLDFVPRDVLPSGKKIDYELKSLTVSVAKEDERLGETQVGLFGNQYETSFRSSFKEALEEAIAKSAIFNDGSSRKLSLTAKVMKFQTPSIGLTFDTNMIVRYQLIDRASGKLMFTRDIESIGTVPVDYAFLGATRYTEARNRAARENIDQFINSLSGFKDQ